MQYCSLPVFFFLSDAVKFFACCNVTSVDLASKLAFTSAGESGASIPNLIHNVTDICINVCAYNGKMFYSLERYYMSNLFSHATSTLE